MRSQELKERHRQVMQNMLMDMLRALATPNMDIRKKTLDIALDLINQHNIDEVMPWRTGNTQSPSLGRAFNRAQSVICLTRDALETCLKVIGRPGDTQCPSHLVCAACPCQ